MTLHKVNWENISCCQKLSEEFIIKYLDKINFNDLYYNEKIDKNMLFDL